MLDRRFSICGKPVPPCLGRHAILERMTVALTKPTPAHLQVIGPRFAGKTVVLSELAQRFRNAGTPYACIVFWDLGHQAFKDDDHFVQTFRGELLAALRATGSPYAEHMEAAESTTDIAEVLDALKDEGIRILVILDAFDNAVSNGRLTRNLWDQLRRLADIPTVRLVVASRRRLSELIRDPNAETSPFWNIFEPTPIRIGPFDEQDLDALLKETPELHLAAGARTELLNATNASTIPVLEVFNTLMANSVVGEVSPEVMRNACKLTFPAVRDRIGLMWEDCARTSQDLFHRVREVDSVLRSEVTKFDADALTDRGFVHSAGNKLQRPSQLVEMYLEEQPNESSSLARLFSTAEGYRRNLKSVMERRIDQIGRIDQILKRHLQLGSGDLPEYPNVFLGHIRNIADRAFELIWKAEIPNKRILSDWMVIWKRNDERGVEDWETTFPSGGRRLRLLNLMTGTDKSAPCARHVTKATYVLLNAVHAFGDFGQHQEGAPVDPGTAYAALHLCIELAAALNRELPAGQ